MTRKSNCVAPSYVNRSILRPNLVSLSFPPCFRRKVLDLQFFYQTSIGPFGTEMALRSVFLSSSSSCMKLATMGGSW
jgi:hypothetical protein